MAVTQDQLSFINTAVNWLSPEGTGRTTLGRDVSATVENLVTILNENNPEGDPDIEYDPAQGYTPELGAKLQAQLAEFKDSWTFTGLVLAEKGGGADAMLQGENYEYLSTMPVRADATKLIQLVQNGDRIIGALDAAYEAGELSLAVAEPDPLPENSVVEDDPADTETAEETAEETAPSEDTDTAAVEDEPPAPDNPFGDTIEDVELSTDGAVELVENALKGLAPQINSITGSFNGISAGGQAPGFLTAIAGEDIGNHIASFFSNNDMAGSLLSSILPNARIEEINKADDVFDLRSQAALQGLMTVLSHPLAMGLSGENPHLYTPAKGQEILSKLEAFKKKIAPFADQEQLKSLNEQLTKEKVSILIAALDKLHADGLISKELLIDPDGAAVEIPADIIAHFQERITMPTGEGALASIDMHSLRGASGLIDQNPDMLRLMDEFTRGFTGRYGMAELMPDLDGVAGLMAEVDGALTAEQRLATFYTKAREAHGGTSDEFAADLLVLLDTTMLLPYGEKDYRAAFRAGLYDAIVDAANISDPTQAGQHFASAVTQTATSLRDEYGQPAYTQMVDIDVPRWRPGLAGLEITSGGQIFDGAAIAQAYDDYNLSEADTENRRAGQSNEWYRQGFITFKDDNGQVYVAVEDDETRMFTVEPVNGERLAEIYYDTSIPQAERLAMMREADPAAALLINADGSLEMGANSYDQLVRRLSSDNHYDLSELAAGYGRMAKAAHDENARLDREEAGRNTQIQLSGEFAHEVDRTLPELPDHITGESLLRLREYVRLCNLPADPHLLHAGSKNIQMLKDHAGHGLAIGTKPQYDMPSGADLKINRVHMHDEPQAGRPMMAYYDDRTFSVRVIEVPDVILDHEARNALLSETRELDSLEFMQRIKDEHPDLFEMTQAYRRGDAEPRSGSGGTEGHKRLHNEPLSLTDYWGFKEDLRSILLKAEQDLGGRTYPTRNASAERLAFDSSANPVLPSTDELPSASDAAVDEMRRAAAELTGDAPSLPEPRDVVPAEDYTNDA